MTIHLSNQPRPVRPQRVGHPLTSVLALLFVSIVALGAHASYAMALTLGLGWSGDYVGTEAEMEVIRHSGASMLRVPFDFTRCNGANWAPCDNLAEKAWEHGLTLLPGLGRSNSEGTRFLTPTDPGWGTWWIWGREIVERYGYNGDFWTGKSNPKPVTDWEVWNEPNLVSNNPHAGKSACQAEGQTYYEQQNSCVQPKKYGTFLVYTAGALQEGSQNKAGKATGVLFGGIAFPYGDNYANFLTKAYSVSGVSSAYTGLSIHPYGFDFEHYSGNKTIAEFQEHVNGVRSHLNGLPGGSGKTLWITELGWCMSDFGDQNFPAVLNESEQANLLNASFNWVKSVASEKSIQSLFWYNTRDIGVSSWDYTCGLRKQGGEYRQAWRGFQEQADAEPWPSPAAVTEVATGVDEEHATLHGEVNPNGISSSYHFEYGKTAAYGVSAPVQDVAVGNGLDDLEQSVMLSGLEPRVRYHFRIVATSEMGTSYGADRSFTTGLKWNLKNSNSAGAADQAFWFGNPGDSRVTGDWNGNGTTTIGTYNQTTGDWKLRNSNSTGGADIAFQYGGGPWKPVTGDWDGNGTTTIGLFDPSTGIWRLRNSNSAGSAEVEFGYGGGPWTTPLVGDWDGNGTTTIGVYEPNVGTWRLRNKNSAGGAEVEFQYGGSVWKPVTGDWDGNGTTTIGVYEQSAGTWRLRNKNSGGSAEVELQYGGGPWGAVTGDWDGNGTDTVGVAKALESSSWWALRNTNTSSSPDLGPDLSLGFGNPGDSRVTGDWNGNGTTTIGTYNQTTGDWKLRNSNSTGGADIAFQYGGGPWKPVTGDWDGNGTTTIGLFDPSTGIWRLRNSNSAGSAEVEFGYGGGPWTTPLVGDWDGNGTTTIGVYEPNVGTWRLRNKNSAGGAEVEFQYGGSVWKPVTGDWDGNGTTTIGVYEQSAGTWRLRNKNSGGSAEVELQYGGGPWGAVTGDWDGNGTDTVGVANH